MLQKSEINTIESIAYTVLEGVFGSSIDISIPVSLEKIVEKYKITVATGEFENSEVSGVYEKTNKTIYIADDEASNRKAFTVAHELGHYFLHGDKVNDIFYRSQILKLTDENKKEEQEANWFASALLMPEKQVKHFYSLTKNMGELAVIFGVSSTAVYFRLKNLGLTA
jgi:Zn-dependent peptidase ImmA (M78 family)